MTEKLKVVVFAIMNYEILMTDIARGGGEHLQSFAYLVGLPADRHADFFQTAQSRYQWVYTDTLTRFESLDRLLGEYYDPSWKDVLIRQRS